MDTITNVSFITVNSNTKLLLKKLLVSFKVARLLFTHSVVVMDSGSSDGSIEFLREREQNQPNFIAILNYKHMWYGEAVNTVLSAFIFLQRAILKDRELFDSDFFSYFKKPFARMRTLYPIK